MVSVLCKCDIGRGILDICRQIGQYQYVKVIYFLSFYCVGVDVLVFMNSFLVIYKVFNLGINKEKIICYVKSCDVILLRSK